MTRKKTLELKVTVEGEDPDGMLARMPAHPDEPPAYLTVKGQTVHVTKLERADGQPFGADAAFEVYWQESNDPDEKYDASHKDWARDAFLYGVRWAKEQK